MSKQFKKICALHDLSCYGRCALTVIIPTMSRLGCQVVPIPTAILSTHTGGFSDMFFMDLTDQMEQIADHLKSINVNFDAIFAGFLGSEHQIDTVNKILNDFSCKENIFMLDPVMGDDGVLYSTYNSKMVEGMKALSHKADIITPNLTEACMLANIEYTDLKNLSINEAETKSKNIIKKLTSIYPNTDIVLTGVVCKDKIITLAKQKEQDEIAITENPHHPISFPGTGDLFASLLLSQILTDKSFFESSKYASDMTTLAVKISQNTDEETRNGVLLEKFLSNDIF